LWNPVSAPTAKSGVEEIDMLIFDQIRKNDAQLQLLAAMLCCGLLVLLVGLWWVQIVNANRYRASVETQSFRTVRIASVRGKILDRNGVALADNRPSYNVSLYLEELSNEFKKDYKNSRPRKVITTDQPFWKDWLGVSPVKTQYVRLTDAESTQVIRASRYRVVQNVANKVSSVLQTPITLNFTNFTRHYETARSMPYCVVSNLSPSHLARFEEQAGSSLGVDLDIQSKRIYPHSNIAAHVIGYVRSDDSSAVGEDAFFSYRTPDYRGFVGIEGGFDQKLRGRAGAKSVQVNNLGYRQTENIWEQAVPGINVVLTLDFEVQREAETALRKTDAIRRGAVVVMDVRTGDVLALASNPTFSPNQFAHGISQRDYDQIQELTAAKNRATAEQYQAGSIFKTIIALAALENGLDKNKLFRVDPNPRNGGKGAYILGNRIINDTAPPGDYDLERAIVRSSNSYFVQVGLQPNVFERVLELGRRLHLGERMDTNSLPLKQIASGHFPTAASSKNWQAGDKANICIGQGEMDVTPMQMAVMTSALANGGTVLKPRLVNRLESQDPTSIEPPLVFPRAQVRDRLGVSKRSLDILRDAMLQETESSEGTGKHVLGCGFRVCGKTGTAERDELRAEGQKKNTTWFASFAPYESPRYAVIVMVENGASGGGTCAPIAHDVYKALANFEARTQSKTLTPSTR
jgi:penicillin-binding protein 2